MRRSSLFIITAIVWTVSLFGARAHAACPAPIVLSLGDNNPSLGTQFLGDDGLTRVMMQLKISNFEEEVGISHVTIMGVGSGDEAKDVEEVRLYQDVDEDGELDGGDLLLGSGAYQVDEGEVVLSATPNTALMTGGASSDVKNALVVYVINGSARSGSTFTARLADNGDLSALGGACGVGNFMGAPVNGETLTLVYGSASAGESVLPSASASVSALSYVFDGERNVPMLRFRVAAGANEDLLFDSVTIRDAGAASNPSQISAVRLWHDADGDGEVSDGDSQLNPDQVFDEGVSELELVLIMNNLIPENSFRDYLLTYSFAGPAEQTAAANGAAKVVPFLRRLARGILAAPFAIAGCGQQGTTGLELSGAPEEILFTDVAGSPITSADAGDVVQIRTADGLPILQFTMGSSSLRLENVKFSRDEYGTFIALSEGNISMSLAGPATGVSGLPQELTAFLPCGNGDNGVMICSDEGNLGEDLSRCRTPRLLKTNSYASGDYTWTNTAKGDFEDCTISAKRTAFESFFGTGALWKAYQPSIDDPGDLTMTGVSSDKSISPPSVNASGIPRTLISSGD